MERINSEYLISIDSETGKYFLGEHHLKTQAQIDAVIKYEVNERVTFLTPRNKPRRIDTTLLVAGLQQGLPTGQVIETCEIIV